MKNILCLLATLSGFHSFAAADNQHKLDSLLTVLSQATADTHKVYLLNAISFNFDRLNMLDSSGVYAKRALELAEKTGNKKLLASSLHSMGAYYKRTEDYTSSMDHMMRSVSINKEIGNKSGVAKTMVFVGYLHEVQGEYEEALRIHKETSELKKELGENPMIALFRMGGCYVNLERYVEGIMVTKKALQYAIQEGAIHIEAGCYNGLGMMYSSTGDTELALENYQKAIDIKKQFKDTVSISGTMINIGSMYMEMGESEKAIEYAKEGFDLAEAIGFQAWLRNASAVLFQSHKQLGQYEEALTYHMKMVEIQDSLLSASKGEQMKELAAKYQNEQSKAEIEWLTKEKEMQADQLNKEAYLRYALFGGLGLFLVLGLVVLRGYRNKRRSNKNLANMNSKITTQKEIIEDRNKDIMDSILYAKRIQSSILPPDGIVRLYLKNSFIFYKPKDIVAGDFYWMEHAGDSILFAAADCTGHGVPGAMVSVVCNNALNSAVREFKLTEPAAILNKVNEIVTEQFATGEHEVKDGMDISLVSLNTKTREAMYAGANSPLYHISGEELTHIKADKQPIGMHMESTPFTNHALTLQEGDSIYLFSDGFADQFGGPNGKKYKYKPFKNLLLSFASKTMEEQRSIMDKEFEKWQGELEQVDDVCVIGVKV